MPSACSPWRIVSITSRPRPTGTAIFSGAQLQRRFAARLLQILELTLVLLAPVLRIAAGRCSLALDDVQHQRVFALGCPAFDVFFHLRALRRFLDHDVSRISLGQYKLAQVDPAAAPTPRKEVDAAAATTQVLSFTVGVGPLVLTDSMPLSRAAVLEYISLRPMTSPFPPVKVK